MNTLSWIANRVESVHSEFRRDRITAAFNRAHDSAPVFTVCYVLHVISFGRRAATGEVESLCRGDRFARTGIERSR